MNNDLVKRLRQEIPATHTDECDYILKNQAADRIEELERHVELRDWFLVENDLWEKFAKNAEGKK